MSDGVGGEAYGYDRLGRTISLTKTIGATNYPLAYAYNLASELTSITYPSGRVVAQSFDNIGRLSQITSSSVNYLTVATSNGYNAANEVLSATYGNGVAATFGYNARLQLASLAYAKSGSNLFSLTYNYAAGNNGQIQSITDNVDNGRTVNYTYDAWSRLKTAATVGSAAYPAWGLSWPYDRYGNRKQQTVTAGSNMPSNSVTISPTANRITDAGYAYDLVGNMTSDGSNTLTYDAENRVTNSANGGSAGAYVFDGNSLRLKKTVSGATTVYIFSGTKVVAEYASGAAPSSPSKEYIYAGSQLLATLTGPPASATANYHIADHLSPRVTTDSNGTVVGQQAHFPYGEDWYASSSTTKFKFTSYERDSESGNDYAMMRSSVNRLGRFSSPDLLAGRIFDPQSLNRYAYVMGDPINMTDPLGLDGCYMVILPNGEVTFMCDVSVPLPKDDASGGGSGPDQAGSGGTRPRPQPLLDDPPDIGHGPAQGPGLLPVKAPLRPVDPIWDALKKLRDVLANDPDCLTFLNSKGIDALGRLSTIMDGYYGQAGMLPTKGPNGVWRVTNAVSFGYPGQLVTVNSVGAFFAGQLGKLTNTTDTGRIPGGTPAAQGFILLHELGHNTDVLAHDFNNQSIGDANNKQLEQHCMKTIKAFSH